ncbi:RidA family protein [Paragemmobacter straminiformis]|uniref:RidA family protein n=1 Tax=Paragemmobacter straminiformis TaxID=2045119 RepID=A0A842IAM7_9RHOB|nr:RidA family protein [Gemmobacter straminiformis]MBC2836661.1 RidA family protein [Gemmobacter straminiformis]
MSLVRYGTGQSGAGKQPLPFARAVQADGWLHVSGQVAMKDGEIVGGGIVAEARRAIENMIAILNEAGYGTEDIVRVGVWLDDPRDFWSFNAVYAEYFGANPPARACVQSRMMVDCKVEVDCVAFRADKK